MKVSDSSSMILFSVQRLSCSAVFFWWRVSLWSLLHPVYRGVHLVSGKPHAGSVVLCVCLSTQGG